MRIGIVTFHAACNYGAVLQAYALQTYLQKMGHEPFFINYIHHGLIGERSPGRYLIKAATQYFVRRQFSRFRATHLNISGAVYREYKQLQSAPPAADVYVCGSDQIWNPYFCRYESDLHVSWLDFGDDRTRRVAYAASFGVCDLDSNVRATWAAYAKRFHAVSVRERNGVGLMKALGHHDAVWVPDPTLLLDASEYGVVESDLAKQNTSYLFSYQLGLARKLASKVTSVAQAVLGLPCRKCHMSRWGHAALHVMGPGEWLLSLRRSSCVITDSFHGLALSLVYRRPFIVLFSTNAGRNTRIMSLLDVVGLRHRAVAENNGDEIARLCREQIDWERVDARLRLFRDTGCRFLHAALACRR